MCRPAGELRVPDRLHRHALGARGGGCARRAHRRSAGGPGSGAGAAGEDHRHRRRPRRVPAEGSAQAGAEELGLEVRDVGVYEEKPADYPDLALKVAELVASGTAARGIVIDGAGIGSSHGRQQGSGHPRGPVL